LLSSGFQRRTLPFLWIPELPRPQLPGSHSNSSRLNRSGFESESESESYVTTDGHSASPSWNKASIWGLGPDFHYCQTFAGLLMWGALSDERTGVSFTTAAGLASAVILGSESRGTGDHILLSQMQDFPFRRLLRLAGLNPSRQISEQTLKQAKIASFHILFNSSLDNQPTTQDYTVPANDRTINYKINLSVQ
jgi:hypothetical protein